MDIDTPGKFIGNLKVFRIFNRGLILNTIRLKHPIYRNKISGLNKSLGPGIISELLKEDLTQEEGIKEQCIVKNPLNLSLKQSKPFIGAINLAHAITRFAIADINSCLIIESSLETLSQNSVKFIQKCFKELRILGFENIIKLIDPGSIILGARISYLQHLISRELIQFVSRRNYFGRENNIKVLPSSLKVRPRLLNTANAAS